jgi:CheY-like chemotaxis protein
MMNAQPNPEASLLRQFLRALMNDSFAGDELAVALVAGADLVRDDTHDSFQRNLHLLKTATRLWREQSADQTVREPFLANASALLPRPDDPHQVVGLLTDVFALSEADVADVWDLTPDAVRQMRLEERQKRDVTLSGMALIVEDDPIIAQGVADVVSGLGLTVTTICDTVKAAVMAADQNPPDVLISDYDLGAGGNGADAAHTILAAHNCPVIFVTAYPERVLTGADFEPTFVLPKPCQRETLRAALYYALTRAGLSVVDAEQVD